MRFIISLLFIFLFSGLCIAQDTAKYNCPDVGKAKTPAEQKLNLLKNRETTPGTIDPSVSLTTILTAGYDTGRFSSGQFVSVTGWILEYEEGGPESCNCFTHNEREQDTRLFMGHSMASFKDSVFMVVVTPKYSLNHLFDVDKYIGHLVTITGYLMFDTEKKTHVLNTCKNCHAAEYKTAWEIRPISSITIVK